MVESSVATASLLEVALFETQNSEVTGRAAQNTSGETERTPGKRERERNCCETITLKL